MYRVIMRSQRKHRESRAAKDFLSVSSCRELTKRYIATRWAALTHISRLLFFSARDEDVSMRTDSYKDKS